MESHVDCLLVILTIITTCSSNPVQTTVVAQGKADMSAPFMTTPLCANKVDIVLALDSSGSMESSWNEQIDDAEILMSKFLVGETTVRVSIIDYSAVTNMVKPLDANNTDEDVFQALEKLRKIPQFGETWPELALERAADIFAKATPTNNASRKCVVLFTDGEITSKDKDSVAALMKNLEINHIEVFVIEKGNKTLQEEGVQLMASNPENVYDKSERPKYGQPLLEHALCWNKSSIRPGEPLKPSVKTTPTTILSTATKIPGDAKHSTDPNAETIGSGTTTTLPITNTVSRKCEEQRSRALKEKTRKMFLPRCTNDGRFEALQNEPGTNISWCVNQITGEELYGTRAFDFNLQCAGNNETSSPRTKCEIEREKQMLLQRWIPDIHVPLCSRTDGLYEQIQNSPWFSWCVNRYSGQRIEGAGTFKTPLCPENTPCEEQQEIAIASNYKQSNSTSAFFVPECEDNGFYRKLQFSIPEGVSWCVDEVTGKEINGTRNNGHGDALPVCSVELNYRCLLPVFPCSEKTGKAPQFVFNVSTAQCEKTSGHYCGKDPTENEFVSMDDCQEACGVLTKCMIDRDFAISRSIHKREHKLDGLSYIPRCDENGQFEQQQVHQNGSSWCVDMVTGGRMENTFVKDGKLADCSKVPTHIDKEIPVTCVEERTKILSPMNGMMMIGAFVPQCDQDGKYLPIQTHGSTGSSWCVDTHTGIKINGTQTERMQGKPICPNHSNMNCLLPKDPGFCKALFPRFYYDWQKNQCVRFNYGGCQGNMNRFMDLKSCSKACILKSDETVKPQLPMKPELTIKPLPSLELQLPVKPRPYPHPEPGPVISEHGMPEKKPYAEPEAERIPAPATDIYNPVHSCIEERDFAKQRKDSLQFMSVFIPECDTSGNFKVLQRYGSTGETWCVDPTTGKMIEGTRRGPGQGEPDCTKGTVAQSSRPYAITAIPADSAPIIISPVSPTQEAVLFSTPATIPSTLAKKTLAILSPIAQTTAIPSPFVVQATATPGQSTTIPTARFADQTTPTLSPFTEQTTSIPLASIAQTSTISSNSVMHTPPYSSSQVTTKQKEGDSQTDQMHVEGQKDCDFVIGLNLMKLGCFRDTHQIPQPLPVDILNRSAEAYRVKDNQEQFASFLRKLVCECANVTRQKGWFTFGLQNYGTCYSGPDEGRYREDGIASEDACLSETNVPCSTNDTLACTGVPSKDSFTGHLEYPNFVYMIKTKEHQAVQVIQYDRRRRASLKLANSIQKDLDALRLQKKKS